MEMEHEINYGVSRQNTLLETLIDELKRGMNLIAVTDDVTYCRVANSTGSIGGQFRHNLDFVSSILKGIDRGRIDYDDRERDVHVEIDKNHASDRFAAVIRNLAKLDPRVLGKSVLVRSEIDPATWLPSSVSREVEFVHSHTVHHHALIGEKLAGFGVTVTDNFGVALSTLEYWEKQAA